MSQQPKISWGSRIAILYGSFVVFILAVGAFASFQSFHLVEKDYYPRELRYQEQIEKIARGRQGMTIAPQYDPLKKTVIFRFDRGPGENPISGTILFFRPSDPDLDYSRKIEPDDAGTQIVDVRGLSEGLWRIKIDWSIDTIQYYLEDILVIE